jgi:PEP-CTERM motif
MKFKPLALSLAAAAVTVALPQVASAGLVFDAGIFVTGQGFGNVPRDLTLSSPNNETFESGAVGVSNTGAITFGVPITNAQVHDSNGVQTVAGTASLPNPLADDQKYGIPTIGSLGITSASQIGILFNATEPGGNDVNITDLTLKFYTGTGTLLGAIDGQQSFGSTIPGNGGAGFVFRVSDDELAFVNGLLATGGATTTLALEASIQAATGGPESFAILNIAAIPEPETYALILAGLGALGFVSRRRRRT